MKMVNMDDDYPYGYSIYDEGDSWQREHDKRREIEEVLKGEQYTLTNIQEIVIRETGQPDECFKEKWQAGLTKTLVTLSNSETSIVIPVYLKERSYKWLHRGLRMLYENASKALRENTKTPSLKYLPLLQKFFDNLQSIDIWCNEYFKHCWSDSLPYGSIKPKKPERLCGHCGTPLLTPNLSVKYCSDVCREEEKRKQRRKYKNTSRTIEKEKIRRELEYGRTIIDPYY